MKKGVMIVGMLILTAGQAFAGQWTEFSEGLIEPGVARVAMSAKSPDVYVATEARLFKTTDEGASWKRVLSLRGEKKINFVLVSPMNVQEVYVAHSKGIERSLDGGKHWEKFYAAVAPQDQSILCLAMDEDQGTLWAGSGSGVWLYPADKTWRKSTLPPMSVVAIRVWNGSVFVASDKGIYRSIDGGENWQEVFPLVRKSNPAAEDALQQFDIEEISAPAFPPNIIRLARTDHFYAAANRSLVGGGPETTLWDAVRGTSVEGRRIVSLTASARAIYFCTEKYILRWDSETEQLMKMNDGLEAAEIREVVYDPGRDALFAVTRTGVYRLLHPEIDIRVAEEPKLSMSKDILSRFSYEPTILEVQKAAALYAEVNNEKIQAWRRAAATKAWMPTVSLDTDLSRDQNVDLDRGGTNDPDRFIIGPEEKSLDWSVGVSWDLGELIWNDDQTSIDTRSKLMVELRDDILNQVTRYYFERRRLQVEMALTPVRDLPIQVEKELKLQELTANIDALTGGYFSKQLIQREAHHE